MKQIYDNNNDNDYKNDKFVSITFDDGSRSIYSKGLKIIKDNNVNATV
ncbi:MAG: polysaccharide deacetylase family protein, partial [bacterium]